MVYRGVGLLRSPKQADEPISINNMSKNKEMNTMLKRVLRKFGALALPLVFGGSAYAACPAFPYSFTNGSTADASQVNSDFQNVINCFAPLANPSFTGSVGIGTAFPQAPLDIRYASDYSDILHVSVGTQYLTFGSYGTSGYSTINSYNSSTGARVLALQTTGASLGVGTTTPAYVFSVNGTAGGTSSWQVTSDERLKKNISTLTGGLDMIERLRPVHFQWRSASERSAGKDLKFEESKTQIGFIAQEVEKIVPEAVVAPSKSSAGLYSLKEADLIPVLVAAVKEQQAEIEQLKAQVASLKSTH